MIKLLVVFICAMFSIAFAFRNAYQREESGVNHNANRKWHLWEFIIKLCFALVVGVLTPLWFHKVFGVLMVTSIDFLLFPLVLNFRTKQKWYYLSDNGIDKFLKKINPHLLFVVKMILVVISVTYYIVNPFK